MLLILFLLSFRYKSKELVLFLYFHGNAISIAEKPLTSSMKFRWVTGKFPLIGIAK
jgi:hypothetical protein